MQPARVFPKNRLFLFLLATFLIACVPVEPVEVTRPTSDATSSPTAVSSTTTTATVTVAETSASPTLLPSPTPEPSPTITPFSTMTPTPTRERPSLPVIAPPPGLVYRMGNEWRRVNGGGESELLLTHDGPLSLNPDATLALSGATGERTLTLHYLPQGGSETIEREGRLMSWIPFVRWLEEETAVLTITGEGSVTQSTSGYLALLHLPDGQLTVLEPELSVYAQPAVGPERTIVFKRWISPSFELLLWQNGQTHSFELGDVGELDELFTPVLSPDGAELAGQIGGDFGEGHTRAYAVIDLVRQTSSIVHTYTPIPTDARLESGIHWNADGTWLALTPPTCGICGEDEKQRRGVWLVSADGEKWIHLGMNTGGPVWIDPDRVVYTVVVGEEAQLHLYDLATQRRARLNLPPVGAPANPDFLLREESGIFAVQFVSDS